MNIGIIGSGHMGSALGAVWAQAGHKVLFSTAHDEQHLQAAAEAAGSNARTGSAGEAATFGDVVFIAVQFPALRDVLMQTGPMTGKVVLTCMSGLVPDMQGERVGLPTELTRSVAEELAALVPEARVVEAFNLTFAELIARGPQRFGSEKASLPFCGDDAEAKATVAQLITDAGYEPVDVGPLKCARSIETLATIWYQFAVTTGLGAEVGIKLLHAK